MLIGMRLVLAARKQQTRLRTWLRSRGAIDAAKCTLAFVLGQLLCYLPGYAKLWFVPASLADQISFTLLGGVSLPLGGFLERMFFRFGGGIAFSVPMYIILMLLGHHQLAQGIVYGIFIFLLSWFSGYSRMVGGAMFFAQTACTYAVTNSFRSQGAFQLRQLQDLLQGWAMGAAVSVFVNLAFFPRRASSMLVDHLQKCLVDIQMAVDYLYSDKPLPVSGQQINAMLVTGAQKSTELLNQARWEVAYQRATMEELTEVVKRADDLQFMLATCVLDLRYYQSIRAQHKTSLQVPVDAYRDAFKAALVDLSHNLATKSTSNAVVVEEPFRIAQTAFVFSSAELMRDMVASLDNVTAIKEFSAASHAISAALPVAERLQLLGRAMAHFTHRSRTLQFPVLDALWSYFTTWDFRNPLRIPDNEVNPFVGLPSVPQRIVGLLVTEHSAFALKVTGSMLCLMAILWSPDSRSFFLSHNLPSVTVPLILALMVPTVGASLLSWVAELCGTVVGILVAALTTVTWRGVDGAAMNVPGIVFFEFLFTACLGYRLAWQRDDMLAVIALFSLGGFVNEEFQARTNSPPPDRLKDHVVRALVNISIVIGLAVPFQLLVLHRQARAETRAALAKIMRDAASIIERTGTLVDKLFYPPQNDPTWLEVEGRALLATTGECRDGLLALRAFRDPATAEFFTYDGFHAQRYDLQLSALQRIVAACDISVRVAMVGPFDARVARILTQGYAEKSRTFTAAAATILWCQSAALSILENPPNSLPPISVAAAALYETIKDASIKSSELDMTEGIVNSGMRRFWQFNQLLLVQKENLEVLADLLRGDWATGDALLTPEEEEAGVDLKDLKRAASLGGPRCPV